MPTVGVCADEVSEHIPKLKSSFWCIMGTCSVLLSCLNFGGEWGLMVTPHLTLSSFESLKCYFLLAY